MHRFAHSPDWMGLDFAGGMIISFLEDIAVQLNSAGVGVYPGTSATRTIYIGEMPDSPDALIALYARPGRRPMMHSGGDIRQPDLHVEVRAATYSAATAKIDAIDAALHRTGSFVVGATRYVSIQAIQEMAPLSRDGRNRSLVSQNFEVKFE